MDARATLQYGAVPAARMVREPRGGEPRFFPLGERTSDRERAERVAAQFEQLFVRSMVSSLRSTAAVGGAGGMFGQGPGSDTFADWFDQNLAERISRTTSIGLEEQLLADLERHGEIPKDLAATARAARAAADRTPFHVRRPPGAGGIDVVSG
jgi:Rod binding domain-containing protein